MTAKEYQNLAEDLLKTGLFIEESEGNDMFFTPVLRIKNTEIRYSFAPFIKRNLWDINGTLTHRGSTVSLEEVLNLVDEQNKNIICFNIDLFARTIN